MKNYFTISEFAKLRNININSLRYYEKIDLLKPAVVDKNNGYRYYAAEQLSMLDTILLCIDLKIPLKELEKYIGEDGLLDGHQLFEDGKQIALQRINEIQIGLNKIEYALQSLTDCRDYANIDGIYKRYIRGRRFYITEYAEQTTDVSKLEKKYSDLYMKAQTNQLSPIFPAGLMICQKNGTTRFFLFCEIVDFHVKDENIVEIPQGEYTCCQAELLPNTDLLDIINTLYPTIEDKTVIVTNMMLDKYNIDNRKSEFQMIPKL